MEAAIYWKCETWVLFKNIHTSSCKLAPLSVGKASSPMHNCAHISVLSYAQLYVNVFPDAQSSVRKRPLRLRSSTIVHPSLPVAPVASVHALGLSLTLAADTALNFCATEHASTATALNVLSYGSCSSSYSDQRKWLNGCQPTVPTSVTASCPQRP